jgi:hypothetical protein
MPKTNIFYHDCEQYQGYPKPCAKYFARRKSLDDLKYVFANFQEVP